MVGNVVEVVVDGVEEGVTSDLGGTAGAVEDVVVLEGDHVVGTSKVDAPVVVGVAAGGPGAGAVNLGVGDGDTVAGLVAEDNVLATDERGSDVVDPDQVSVVEGDGITAPDEARVEVGNMNVLDDDVLGAHDAQALALDDALVSNTNQTLVRADLDAQNTGLVVLDGDLLGVGLVVVTPIVLVDGQLALRASSPGSTSRLGGGTLGAGEVDGAVEVDDTRLRVAEVRDQLRSALGVHGRSRTTASGTRGETLGLGGESTKGGGDESRDGEEGLEEGGHDGGVEGRVEV